MRFCFLRHGTENVPLERRISNWGLAGRAAFYLHRSSMWMQPAPADHGGPTRVRLRKPETDQSALPGCIPRLVRSLVAQRIATGAERPQATGIRRPRKPKLPGFRKMSPRLADGTRCDPGEVEWLIPHSGPSRPATSISRITPQNHQDQITHSRGCRSRRPGTSHPLSLRTPARPETNHRSTGRQSSRSTPPKTDLNSQTERSRARTATSGSAR
jgi:hypothetical protein